MFHGFMRFGGVEVINGERLAAYVESGCAPTSGDFDNLPACDGLGEALQEGPYVNPAADDAPWFDAAQPETHWFGGVLPLGVTGLDGSTLTAELSERLTDGGTITSRRHSSRVVAVSALLVGRSDEHVAAGLEWLTGVLHRTCAGGDPCAGATLEAFTVCPGPIADTEDLDAAPVAHAVAASADWVVYGGRWESGTFRTNDSAFEGEPDLFIHGGTPSHTGTVTVEGGEPGTSAWDDTWEGGTPVALPKFGIAASPNLHGCREYFQAVWDVTGLAAGVRVAVGAIDGQGVTLARSPWTTVGTTPATLTQTFERYPWEDWRPAIWVTEPGAAVTLTETYRPDLDPDTCLTPYFRLFTGVSCVSGPTVVGDHEFGDDCHLLQVEWTWACGDPFRYRLATPLAADLLTDGSGTPVLEPGVFADFPGLVNIGDTDCADPVAPVDCGIDPLYPTLGTPPRAPRVADPAFSVSSTSDYNRAVLRIEPDAIPTTGVGALRLVLANGSNVIKRGVRVRIWTGESADFSSVPECGFVNEFTLRFLDVSTSIVIDTSARSATVVCNDGSTFDAAGLLRGPYGGAFRWPTLSCDLRHFIAIDVPQPQGRLTVAASLSLREG